MTSIYLQSSTSRLYQAIWQGLNPGAVQITNARFQDNMSPKQNLLNFLLPTSRLPPDVNFLISTSTTPVSIMAHKCFLADASSVFDQMFFLSGMPRVKQGVETVEVKSVTEETFSKFVEHIYGKKLVIEDMSNLMSMLELLLLVDQYDMVELVEKLVERIKLVNVEKEILQCVLNIVEKFEGHNEAKIAVENIISRYMRTNLGSLDSLSTFVSEHNWLDSQTLVYLLGLMNKVVVEEGRSIHQGVSDQATAITCDTREIVREFLMFTEFPSDSVEEMVDKFLSSVKKV